MIEVTKLVNESLFDFIMRNYNSLNYIDLFLEENNLDDLTYFDSQSAGTVFKVTPKEVTNYDPFAGTESNTIVVYKKEFNQNIFDFILTNYGNMSYLNTFLKENNIDNINDFAKLATGTKFKVTNVANKVLRAYTDAGYVVGTGEIEIIGDFNNDYNEDYFNISI